MGHPSTNVETELRAVPVFCHVHEPLHDERLWSHLRQANLCRLRHSAELATITFVWSSTEFPWHSMVMQPVSRHASGKRPRKHVFHGIHHGKCLKYLGEWSSQSLDHDL